MALRTFKDLQALRKETPELFRNRLKGGRTYDFAVLKNNSHKSVRIAIGRFEFNIPLMTGFTSLNPQETEVCAKGFFINLFADRAVLTGMQYRKPAESAPREPPGLREKRLREAARIRAELGPPGSEARLRADERFYKGERAKKRRGLKPGETERKLLKHLGGL